MKALGHALACLFGWFVGYARRPARPAVEDSLGLYRALRTRNVSDAFTFVLRLRLREHGRVESAASEGVEMFRARARGPSTDELALLNSHARFEDWLGFGQSHQLTRFWLLRLLGFVYSAAFC